MNKKHTGLRKRLMLGNLSILAISVAILSGIFLTYFIATQTQTEKRQVSTIANATQSALANAVEMIDNITLQLSTNSYIFNQMEAIGKMDDNPNDVDLWLMKEVDAFVWSYIVRKDVATRICMYNDAGSFVHVGTSVAQHKTVEYMNKRRIQALAMPFEEGKKVSYFVCAQDPLIVKESQGYIAAVREIRDYTHLNEKEIVGYVEVQLSLDAVDKVLADAQTESCHLALYEAASGNFLVGDASFLDVEDFAVATHLDTPQPYRDGFLQAISLEEVGLYLLVYNDGAVLRTATTRMVGVLLLFVIVVILLVASVQMRFVAHITEPLLALFNQVREHGIADREREHGTVSGEGSYARIAQDAKDDGELEELRESFDAMLDALQKSSDQLMGAQIGKLRAQLLALQAQLDPHFIHNTLSVIVALAQEGNYREVEEVAMRLSEMIRYSTSFDEPVCTIEQELRHLENYLELLSVRYEENFSYAIHNCACGKNFRVPRFITQPIAENALQYSLKAVDYPWNITVECECDAYFWRVIICDNGQGITQQKANEIMKETYVAIKSGVDHLIEELKIGGLSLLNIAARLYLTYEDDMIFCICPAEGGGTKVILGGRIDAD